MRDRRHARAVRLSLLSVLVSWCAFFLPARASSQELLYLWDETSLGHALNCYRIAINPGGSALLPQFNAYNVDVVGAPAGPWLGVLIPAGLGSLSNPRGIALASNGSRFIVDQGNARIVVYDSAGLFLRAWGGAGSDSAHFAGMEDVAIGAGDTVFVSDTSQGRIKVFTAAGVFVRQIGAPGNSAENFGGGLSGPWGIAVDGQGHVFATDKSNQFGGRVKEFTTTGRFVRAWGTGGTQNGQFSDARAITVGPDGRVYVADASGVPRVQVFTNDGVFMQSWTLPLLRNGGVPSPTGIAVDASGRVYVACFASTVFVFSPAVAGIDSDPPVLQLALASPRPNPTLGSTMLRVTLPRTAAADLEICDAAGRLVASWHWPALAPGEHEVVWNGRSQSGQKAAAGVYFSRLRANGQQVTQRFVRL